MLETLNASLEKSLMESIRLLLSLVESSNPSLGQYMREVAQLARNIALQAGLDEAEQNRVEMAGLVHDIGLLGMPVKFLEKDERIMSAEEFDAYSQHPVIAALSLSSVEGLKDIGEIILNHHENMDGSGFPGKLDGKRIPVGSRILAIAADYCTVLHLWPRGLKNLMVSARRHLRHEIVEAVEITDEGTMREEIAEKIILEGVGRRYDGETVRHFIKFISRRRPQHIIKHLHHSQLRAGMTLMQDLRLKDGRLLLTRGTVLNQGSLMSLQSIGDRGLIEGEVSVSLGTKESGKDGGT
jgi:hypothetical protein